MQISRYTAKPIENRESLLIRGNDIVCSVYRQYGVSLVELTDLSEIKM